MRVSDELLCTAEIPRPESLDVFRRYIDPAWIEQALHATGTASTRKRRLPAEQVIWLVMGMGLFRDRSIVELVDDLDLSLPGPTGPGLAKSSVSQARSRLGPEPLKWLFEITGEHWSQQSADQHRWRGLALYGIDGTTLVTPDSEENREYFGAPRQKKGPDGAYPQLKLAALFALRSHVLTAATFGPHEVSETVYARSLWSKIPDHSLCIVDRGFFGAQTLVGLESVGTDRHWLIRVKKSTKWRVRERLGPNELLVEMTVSPKARKKDPSLPKTWTARAVRYQRKGFSPQWLLTSLLDPELYPAREIVNMYHERWELELAYDEIKCEMLDREETIRSKSPERVAQEVWGLLLAYNLVRLEMDRVASEAGVSPTRISFITALHFIRDEFIFSVSAAPGAIPRHLRQLRTNLKRYILPARRPQRCYPRAVKVSHSRYPTKHRPPQQENAK